MDVQPQLSRFQNTKDFHEFPRLGMDFTVNFFVNTNIFECTSRNAPTTLLPNCAQM